MRYTPAATLSAVTIAVALGVGGCGGDPVTAVPVPADPGRTTIGASPSAAPLPVPDALTSVLYRLADTSIPAQQKLGLIQYSTTADLPVLQNFGEALAANGFEPLTVEATDLASAGTGGNVVAMVKISAPDPAVEDFSFPLEFNPMRDGWQLTQRSADQLLPLITSSAPTPPR